jgi:hypothetical protein
MNGPHGAAPDVVSVSDIGAMAGVSRQRAAQLMDRRTHETAPESTQTGAGAIWDRQAVAAYLLSLGRAKTWED